MMRRGCLAGGALLAPTGKCTILVAYFALEYDT